MQKAAVPHHEVIDLFGGLSGIAKALGQPTTRVSHWRKRGIPPKYWPVIAQTKLARQHGITERKLMRGADVLSA